MGGLSAGVLDYLARSIVDDEDAVDIEVDEGRRSVMLRLHVSPSDMGRVIGRRGRVAQAIRTVVRAAGAREGVDGLGRHRRLTVAGPCSKSGRSSSPTG